MEGAVAVASATLAALEGRDARAILDGASGSVTSRAFTDKFAVAAEWLASGRAPDAREVRGRLGSGMLATESCVTAVYLAARFADASFSELLAFAAACGGDVDTVSAMAGAVWGARRGVDALPEAALERLEDCARIARIATALHAAAPT
jgi:ADP-ribosylglycohydrolase